MSGIRAAAVWGMAAQYGMFVAQFATSVVISRFFLTPAEVGLFGTALAAAMMISVFQDFGISRYIANEAELDAMKLRRVFSVSTAIALAIGALIALLSWPVARFYGDMALFPILLVIALSYLLVPFAIVPAGILQRDLDFRGLFVVNVGGAAAMAAVTIGAAAAGWSAMALAFGTIAQAAARAVLAIWTARAAPHWPPLFSDVHAIVRFGLNSSALTLSGALGSRTPELIIGRVLDFAAVGLYGRAMGLSGQLRLLVSGSIGGVFFPAFARMRDRGESFAAPYLRVVSAYTVTTWPAMAFLAVAAAPVVALLYGPNWSGVALLLTLIALSEVFFTALPLHMDVPIVLNRIRELLWRNWTETAVSIALVAVAATVSLELAAASRIAYGLAWYAIYARFMQSGIGFRWRDMARVYAQSLACTIATVAPLLLVTGGGLAPADFSFLTIIGAAIAGCVLWFATLFLVRHPARREFVEMAGGLVARLRPPARQG
jgi:O-antigen/teichoic acid export membrane protein